MMQTQRFAEPLRSHGLKVTRRRLAVAGLLFDLGRALSAEQVWNRLYPELGRLGLPSVYRILEELTKADLLTRVELDDRIMRYAACCGSDSHHHHIVCTGCGRVDKVDCEFPDRAVSRIRRRTGFQVTAHRMQVEGLCRDCRG